MKGEPLVYTHVGESEDGWVRYNSCDLFEFSVPSSAELIPMRRGDASLNWTSASLTMRISIKFPNSPSGLAAPFVTNMFYLAVEEDSIETLVSDFTKSLDRSSSTYDFEWIDGFSGRIPVISRLRDEYTLEIVNFFIHGGCWKMVHRIADENPSVKWPSIAMEIAKSIKFICNKSECRHLIHFESK